METEGLPFSMAQTVVLPKPERSATISIDLEKYLNQIPAHVAGRIRYNPASMLKTVLFGFMTYGYISLRELEDNCKVNLRFMYLMEHKSPDTACLPKSQRY